VFPLFATATNMKVDYWPEGVAEAILLHVRQKCFVLKQFILLPLNGFWQVFGHQNQEFHG